MYLRTYSVVLGLSCRFKAQFASDMRVVCEQCAAQYHFYQNQPTGAQRDCILTVAVPRDGRIPKKAVLRS
jgi:hypothetical protein